MKNFFHCAFIAFSLLTVQACDKGVGGGTEPTGRKIEIYRYSDEIIPSTYFSVDVNGKASMVLPTIEHDVCTFGADGPVTVEVGAWREQIESVIIRPLSKDFHYKMVDGKAQFTLKPYDQVVVEINGNESKCLFIFVNPLETDKPDENDPNVKYFKAGTVSNANFTLQSGQTLYVEGGAIARGCVAASIETQDITIRGCGIIDARDRDARGIQINKTKNLTIKDVTLINNNNWSTLLTEADGVTVDNYKVVAVKSTMSDSGKENDALDLLGCKNAVVTNCFGYAHDDVFCIKSHKWDYKGTVDNVVFDNCTAWNTTGGNSFIIGAEINENVSNVTYRNCYSVHSAGEEASRGMYRGGLAVHNCAGGHVSDILFENMYLEDCGEFGICLDIRKSYVNNLGNGVEYTPGTCDGIVLRNINILNEPRFGNLVMGKDNDEHKIKNVVMQNIRQGGQLLGSEDIGDKITVSNADCRIYQQTDGEAE